MFYEQRRLKGNLSRFAIGLSKTTCCFFVSILCVIFTIFILLNAAQQGLAFHFFGDFFERCNINFNNTVEYLDQYYAN